jgi:hypothetical protein
MNAIHSHSVRFFLLLSFAVSGAACSASTVRAHDTLDARYDRGDMFARHVDRAALRDTGAIARR